MKTQKLLKFMHIIAWFVFIGLLIKVGTMFVSYLISINYSQAAKNLFGGINLVEYRNFNFIHYSFIVAYKIALFSIEAYIAFLVIKLLKSLNLNTPFNLNIQQLMQKISYSIFYLWVLAIIHNTHVNIIGLKNGFLIDLFSSDFVFLAAIIFVFAQIIKRGIKIQQENDLTI